MRMKGRYLGKDMEYSERQDKWECPFCGAISYQGYWTDTGVVEDVVGCDHWCGGGIFKSSKKILIYSTKSFEEIMNIIKAEKYGEIINGGYIGGSVGYYIKNPLGVVKVEIEGYKITVYLKEKYEPFTYQDLAIFWRDVFK